MYGERVVPGPQLLSLPSDDEDARSKALKAGDGAKSEKGDYVRTVLEEMVAPQA